jgi:predicted transcriptional regulator
MAPTARTGERPRPVYVLKAPYAELSNFLPITPSCRRCSHEGCAINAELLCHRESLD